MERVSAARASLGCPHLVEYCGTLALAKAVEWGERVFQVVVPIFGDGFRRLRRTWSR